MINQISHQLCKPRTAFGSRENGRFSITTREKTGPVKILHELTELSETTKKGNPIYVPKLLKVSLDRDKKTLKFTIDPGKGGKDYDSTAKAINQFAYGKEVHIMPRKSDMPVVTW